MRSQKLVRRERKSGSEEKAKSKQCLWRKAKEKAKLGKERKDITIGKQEQPLVRRTGNRHHSLFQILIFRYLNYIWTVFYC